MTGAALVVRALEDEGIPFAFGIPGTHNIELYDALAESPRVKAVLVTDERSAPFMADGHWRASGRMACVNVVPGAGLTHALSGIAEAFLDHVPMLVLGCGIRRDTGKAFQLHDVDQAGIVRPVVKGTYHPTSGQELYDQVREACALARAEVVPVEPDATDAKRMIGCGQPIPRGEIVIVDPSSRRPLPPGRVGEIWVRSPSVGIGYYNRPEETRRVFGARLAGGSRRRYLRTGDLGFIHDGELFVAGRLKELIILGGRNYYPQDIEHAVQRAHPALKGDAGAAFSIDGGWTAQ